MPDRFPLALRLLHWAMALLVLAMLFVGVAMVSTAGPTYPALLALHRPIGIAILALVCIRLVIRLSTKAPPLPADLPRAQAIAAKGSHVLLYLALFGMPLIGWAMLSAGGYPVRIAAGLVLPPILPENGLAFGLLRQAHGAIAFLFFALILGHLTVALVHGFVRRDGVLAAMGFGGSPRPAETPEEPAPAPEIEADPQSAERQDP